MGGLSGRRHRRHRFLLRLHLRQIDALDAAITDIDQEVNREVSLSSGGPPVADHPGISDLIAQVIDSEIGIDITRFPTAGHLISWAGLCPRNDESAGKRRSNRLRKGAPWLKTTLVECAWAATHKKQATSGSVPASDAKARAKEGDLRRRRLDFDGVAHMLRINPVSGPRCGSLPTGHPEAHEARLASNRRSASTARSHRLRQKK